MTGEMLNIVLGSVDYWHPPAGNHLVFNRCLPILIVWNMRTWCEPFCLFGTKETANIILNEILFSCLWKHREDCHSLVEPHYRHFGTSVAILPVGPHMLHLLQCLRRYAIFFALFLETFGFFI